MGLQDDVAAVRRAVLTLEEATGAVSRHYSDGLDVRRLQADVSRLSGDLDLLCGAAATPPTPAPALVTIADTEYAHDFWMDAEDEGLGASNRQP